MNQSARKEQEMYVSVPARQAERPKKQVTFNLSRSRLPALVIVLLMTYLAFTFGSQFSSLASMRRDVSSIEQQVQDLKQRNEDLRNELQQVQSDSFIEKAAREKLGLVKAGETRVIPVPEGTEIKKIEPPADDSGPAH
ncbi:septum formation initiator family protein [Pelotomaculum terephthalicicum JT]|uniref:FtsB family cell division protein n=1 Tax=Pelotomaculum TaxID=191373 RepID=UPI0009D2B80C|nr:MULTISPECIES: septum formation initiator family protein [Pelotomaculum]MCG9968303.1 septum formation initiator family protein [Pelotomaculum terephthalicicum JT]OPX89493.1 MAG: cell division protein FtsB [Pelotomaculum sp. PtaB.Bin117]OPY63250.1 MAG: cell division protein FtsB [Pelotomaculum sp. PtaU1.Bin065]